MVFAIICEHASSVFTFVSSEDFTKFIWRAAGTSMFFVNFPLVGISLLIIGDVVCATKTEQLVQSYCGSTNSSSV